MIEWKIVQKSTKILRKAREFTVLEKRNRGGVCAWLHAGVMRAEEARASKDELRLQ